METVRARGAGLGNALQAIFRAVTRNALMIGIGLGFVVNLSGLVVPKMIWEGVGMMAAAALPVALFGLGGILYRYRPEGDMATIVFMCIVSLVMHPALVFVIGNVVELNTDQFRSAVLTAAMAPGINAFVFANLYGVAKRVVASCVLFPTLGSIISVWIWLFLLP